LFRGGKIFEMSRGKEISEKSGYVIIPSLRKGKEDKSWHV
jgi:hypothetical protein